MVEEQLVQCCSTSGPRAEGGDDIWPSAQRAGSYKDLFKIFTQIHIVDQQDRGVRQAVGERGPIRLRRRR